MSRQLYTPPTFGAFGKSGLFQVYDRDSLDHSVKLVSKSQTAEAVVFEPSIVFAPKSQPRGVLKAGFVNTNQYLTGVAAEATVHTDASKASSVTLKKKNVCPKLLPGLNVSLSETTSEKDFSAKPKFGAFTTVSADYSRNNFAATAGVTTDADSNHSVSASAAVGFEGFSVGGDVKLVKAGESAVQPKSYNAGIAYSHKNYTAALVSDSKFEKLKLTLLASKLTADKSLSVGAQAKVDLQAPKVGAPQREVIIGANKVVSANTSYKGAVVLNSGVIVASIEHRLRNPDVLLSASGATSMPGSFYSPFNVNKFGVSVTYGAY